MRAANPIVKPNKTTRRATKTMAKATTSENIQTGNNGADDRRLATATNLAFMVADILESCVVEWQAAMRRAGVRPPRSLQNAAHSIRLGAAQLRREAGLDREGDDLAEAFDDCAAKAWALMLVIIDRFGTDERDMFKAWCWLKAHPSKGHIIMPAWLDSCFATWERQGQEGGGR